jgi:large subunit ribosomal protein L6
MSRVTKRPIKIPSGVTVNFAGNEVHVKGAKGSLERTLHEAVSIKLVDNAIYFEPRKGIASAEALAGTMRAHVNNMIIGVSEGFVKAVQAIGVGYRVQKVQEKEREISFTLGYSQPIIYSVPEGVTVEVPTLTEVVVSGINKELVGQVCADIISLRKVEPYKGKGMRYKGQQIVLKEVKKK